MVIERRIIRLPFVGSGFARGIARIIDVGGNLNDYDTNELLEIYRRLSERRLSKLSGPEAEIESVRAVWTSVGKSIEDAVGAFEAEDNGARLSTGQHE